ncbi:restriction endonuclease subunit S [Romboutsia sp. 1001216sp1]|uniref:restriction endonuclease subunit S n=1 Tax=unclassified Romboutsia TaxID=2626894 RepID=UPI0018A06901|nr:MULTISPECIES: restriction endonuclease subunit S [unclassified Romboutsia]MDB8791050.1 restriction endonuclease subunit S [Romboutsia sp. 1001216sp1]MDB8801225.1 restriction endonuclease subunit S [Romboutsia sp. 1001216sp1]MDB8812624.1 restriction endonuclease subunit S [Romboutsia sp. 1001216sp1]
MSKKLPQGWKKVKLGEIADIKSGGTPSRSKNEYWNNGDIPWIKISDIKEKYINNSEEFITQEGLDNSSTKLFSKGTILFTIFATLGEVGILNMDATTNQAIAGINVNEEIVNKEYLYYFLRSLKETIERNGRGVAQKNINLSILRDYEVLLPSLEEQEKIVSILERAEDAISKREESNRLLGEYLKSVFVDMFGDPVINPKGWDKKKLKDAGTLERGKSKHRPRNAPELLGGIYPLIQTGDIANSGMYLSEYTQTYSELGLKQSKMWNKGTLAITIAANIAKTAILNIDACFPDSVVGFIPNEYTNVEFVCLWMSFLQEMLERTAPESAQKNINLKILGDLDIIVPPIELQEEFTHIVHTVEFMKKKQINSSEELNDLFNSLMQRAFNGEL